MKSNNPFAVHNINYLSPSSINTFIGDKPLWMMRYLFGVKSSSGAGAVRGIAEEYALAEKYEKGFFDFKALDTKFIALCCESGVDLNDGKTLKEKDALKGFGTVLDENFKYENLETYQERLRLKLRTCLCLIMGYVDFLFKDKIVDLKTTNRMPSNPTEAQKRQMAMYSMAYPKKSVDLFFASSKQHKVFTLSNLTKYKKQLKNVAFTIQRFLSLSDDKHELASFEYPNFDKWEWSDDMKKEAKKIWSI